MMLTNLLTKYVNKFNADDEEIYRQAICNEEALDWMERNIPLFECPDSEIEEIYYFRWWTYRKHIKSTPEGFIITEFLPQVPWAGKYNSINCAAGFHIREGRWLKESRQVLEDYIRFWMEGSGDVQSYSTWIADSVWDYCVVLGNYDIGIELLECFIQNFEEWKEKHKSVNGLYWSIDDRDAMEFSISGSGFRPTLNSYMYADALAISKFAEKAQKEELKVKYQEIAEEIKRNIQKYLWNDDFFQVIPAEIDFKEKTYIGCDTISFKDIPEERNVKELIGYIPWYFNIPDAGYEKAFTYLMDEKRFCGKTGLRTADKTHFRYRYKSSHECLWNGTAWPYATSQTLVALANLLQNYKQVIVTSEDYYKLLKIYAKSQHRILDNDKKVPWIDENLDPETGEWVSRSILEKMGWKKEKGGYERGKDYNHSMYCDLIITGLLGINPQSDPVTVNPMIPGEWDYFLLEGLNIRGKMYTVLYDRDGSRYMRGSGLQIFQE